MFGLLASIKKNQSKTKISQNDIHKFNLYLKALTLNQLRFASLLNKKSWKAATDDMDSFFVGL